ncbi:MAG: hypothetical protein RR840_04640 [Clostridium sp.]
MEIQNTQLEILESIKNYLPRLIFGTEEAVAKIHSGSEGAFLNTIPDIIEGTQWSINAMVAINPFVNGEVNIDKINSIFLEMISAMESGDYILVADMLEYELIPIISSWNDIICEM